MNEGNLAGIQIPSGGILSADVGDIVWLPPSTPTIATYRGRRFLRSGAVVDVSMAPLLAGSPLELGSNFPVFRLDRSPFREIVTFSQGNQLFGDRGAYSEGGVVLSTTTSFSDGTVNAGALGTSRLFSILTSSGSVFSGQVRNANPLSVASSFQSTAVFALNSRFFALDFWRNSSSQGRVLVQELVPNSDGTVTVLTRFTSANFSSSSALWVPAGDTPAYSLIQRGFGSQSAMIVSRSSSTVSPAANTDALVTSDGGTTWQAAALPAFGTSYEVAANANRYVLIRVDSTGSLFTTSAAPTVPGDWTSAAAPVGISPSLTSFTHSPNGSTIVRYERNGVPRVSYRYSIDNGLNWLTAALPTSSDEFVLTNLFGRTYYGMYPLTADGTAVDTSLPTLKLAADDAQELNPGPLAISPSSISRFGNYLLVPRESGFFDCRLSGNVGFEASVQIRSDTDPRQLSASLGERGMHAYIRIA